MANRKRAGRMRFKAGYEIKESTRGKRHYLAGRPNPIIQSTNGFNSGGNAGSAAVTLCFLPSCSTVIRYSNRSGWGFEGIRAGNSKKRADSIIRFRSSISEAERVAASIDFIKGMPANPPVLWIVTCMIFSADRKGFSGVLQLTAPIYTRHNNKIHRIFLRKIAELNGITKLIKP
jgi:hypothetical protein